MDWFYIDRNQKRQDFEESSLGDLVKDGTIGPDTLLWNETMSDWQPAGLLFPAWFPKEFAPSESVPVPMEEASPTPAPPDEEERPVFPDFDPVPAVGAQAESEPGLEPDPDPKTTRRVQRASAGTAERVEMIKDFASYLSANRGWIKFFGVIAIIQGSLMCLTIGGALIGWLPIWLGVTVFQSAKAAELAERTGSREYMEEALYRLGFFFKLNGIVVVAIFGFFVLAVVVLLVTGALAAFAAKFSGG